MRNFEITIEEEGINLLDIAIKSNYFLTNSLTTRNGVAHNGLSNPGL